MGGRILVVDDDGLVLKSVAKVLSRAGYDVLTAADGVSALRHAESGPIDGAIVDYTLSRETGLGILQKLRAVHPKCVRMLITARTDSDVFVQGINTGEIHRVVRKPFEGSELLKHLDEAFTSLQRLGQVVIDGWDDKADEERLQLEQVVKRARLSLALQPIVQVSDTDAPTVAWEALLRPLHHSLDKPATLFDIAERHHRVLDVGSHVLELALEVLHQLPDDGNLFVNLHPEQLGHPDRLAADLTPYGDLARRVTLEITERSRLQDIARWEESVRIIQERGFSLAVDDLGAGYSSLSILVDIQPQFIKLDMSLVRNVHLEPRKRRLVSLLRSCGEELQATVIAEGVESEAEMDVLFDCGVRWMQGFWFAVPQPLTAAGPPLLHAASARTRSTSGA